MAVTDRVREATKTVEPVRVEHAAGRLAQSVMPGFDAPPAAEEGERELAPGAGGVPPELFPVLEGARS